MFNFKRKKPIKEYLPTVSNVLSKSKISVFTQISLNATAYYNWIYLNLQMAVWAIDWRDQIWMKLINLILFCFNKVQKSISWNVPGFEIYINTHKITTRTRCYTKKKFSIFSSTRLKILALLFFWPPFNRCQTSDFWTKCIISLNK